MRGPPNHSTPPHTLSSTHTHPNTQIRLHLPRPTHTPIYVSGVIPNETNSFGGSFWEKSENIFVGGMDEKNFKKAEENSQLNLDHYNSYQETYITILKQPKTKKKNQVLCF